MLTCDNCGKGFIKRSYLTQHLKVHSDRKPFSCSVCLKKFRYKQTYDEHLERHAKNKTVQCDVCGKRFYNQRELKGHRSKHAVEGEFCCEICDICFVEESSLQAHYYRLHASYKCSFCDEKFSNKKCLRQHTYRNHKDGSKINRELAKNKKMDCSICGKTLCNKWRLETHLIKKHNIHKTAITEKGFIDFQRRKCLTHNSDRGSLSDSLKEGNPICFETTNSLDEHCLFIGSEKHLAERSDKFGVKSSYNDTVYEVTVTNVLDDNEVKGQKGVILSDRQSYIHSNKNLECNCNVDDAEKEPDKSPYEGNEETYTASRQNSSLEINLSFDNNSECDSERQCRMDMIEADQLIESNESEPLESLQHEFDDEDDDYDAVGAEGDNVISVQDGINIADFHIRASSAALQEYFMRCSQNVKKKKKEH